MIEDDQTVQEMRAAREPTTVARSFMAAAELRSLRETVLRVTQARLAAQLIKPEDGRPVSVETVSNWEHGRRAIPLWAARHIRDLAEAAKRYDAKEGM